VYEGHLNPVSFLAFAPGSYVFATAAKSECLLWDTKDCLKNSGKAVEVSNPERILDLASSDSATSLSLREIGEGTFMVAVTCAKSTSLFFTKASGKKTKVVKRQCLISSADPILLTQLLSESTLSLTHGSVFQLRRTQASLLDDKGNV